MLSHAYAASALRHVPPSTISQPLESDVDPLDWIGPVNTEAHIVVLGGSGAELMCALVRAGAARVTHLRSHERPETGDADVVIVPRVPSLDWLATALPRIRRALVANGGVVLHGGTEFNFAVQCRRMLTLHGFTGIRVDRTADSHTVRATLRPSATHS
jgi:hypothetical protein